MAVGGGAAERWGHLSPHPEHFWVSPGAEFPEGKFSILSFYFCFVFVYLGRETYLLRDHSWWV